MNQVESTPFLTQEALKKVCDEHGIALTAYSPFGGCPRPDKEGIFADTDHRKTLWENETINRLANKYGKTVAQILLKFHVQRGIITIPMAVTKERIEENLNIFDFEMRGDDLDSLRSLNNGQRLVNPKYIKSCKEYPFNE